MSLRRGVAALTTAVVLTGVAACASNDESAAAPAEANAAPAETTDTDSAGSPAAGGEAITMKGFAFTPARLTVQPGATVKIVNEDSAVHDVADAKDGINSGDVKANGTGSVKAPDNAGSYAFICTYHPNMKGTLVVT